MASNRLKRDKYPIDTLILSGVATRNLDDESFSSVKEPISAVVTNAMAVVD